MIDKNISAIVDELLKGQYDVLRVENEILKFWELLKVYSTDLSDSQNLFVVPLPPPNVTGILHLGHVFEHSLSDFLVRFYRLSGKTVVWLPGTDHAGIATQSVVEKNLIKQNIQKEVIGRDKFIEYVWDWVGKCESTIKEQCKRLGDLLYWDLYAFTMDEKRSHAVFYAFEKLYNEGFIYKDKYIVNYCPKCKTALSDDEVEYKEVKGKLYYLNYFFTNSRGKYLTIATVRPETILGDVAVAVHPDDGRYKSYIGQKVILPILERELPVISDNYVDPGFGTGVLKITPAHDFNDYSIGKKHNLPIIQTIDNNGKMNENAGPYRGLDRFECRKRIVEDLKNRGFLTKTQDYLHRIGHCYRCETVIEPNISTQWFVKMRPLAKMIKEKYLKKEFEIIPKRYENMFFHWLDNVRDWCISRQLWWGHRIPFYTCQKCGYSFAKATPPEKCSKCHHRQFDQDPDVLDTWFSSWLWPLSTTGWLWDEKLFSKLYPTTMLTSAWDILFFWDIRMLMAGVYFTGRVPFKTLLLHGLVRDEKNRKFSKSLGNAPQLDKLLEQFGADGIRLGFLLNAILGDDFILSQNTFIIGKHFSNKLWNAFKFFIFNAKNINYASKLSPQLTTKCLDSSDDTSIIVKWIYTEFSNTENELKKAIKNYSFMDYTRTLYKFFWDRFCDWYIEIVKEKIKKGETIYIDVGLDIIRRFIIKWHPIQPFVTEFIYQALKQFVSPEVQTCMFKDSIVSEKIDDVEKDMVSQDSLSIMIEVMKLETFFRQIKHFKKIKGKGIFNIVCPASKDMYKIINLLKNFEEIIITDKLSNIFYSMRILNEEIHINFECDKGLLGFLWERIENNEKECRRKLIEVEDKLHDKDFIATADINVIESYRNINTQLRRELSILCDNKQRIKNYMNEC